MPAVESNFEAILEGLHLGDPWTYKNGCWWSTLATADVRKMTEQMLNINARFVTITAIENAEGELRLDYQWDIDGRLVSYTTTTVNKHIDAITDLTPAADWVEREIHEYFAVEFIGRVNTKPLMTRAGDPIGINLHEGGKA